MELLQEVELLRIELCHVVAKLHVVLDVPLQPELQVGSIGEEVDCFFGEFSRHALCAATPTVHGRAVITKVMAPVLQIMPKLEELCGESSMMISMDWAHLSPWRWP
ncbi:hypothetical protein D1007_10441 [Hordeum vulgare]|nr:hypothetical protein D1007_10441 [Hordeum vulgare]